MRGAVRNASASAIGVFDSGVGGLSVLRHIRAQLPSLPLLYVAASGHVPYGDKTQDYIRERSLVLAEFLVRHGAAAVVIACNTATAAAAAHLRARLALPVIAMEPAVKPAVSATRSGVVGVLATVGTLESARFAALLEQYAGDVEIVTQACPGLVEQAEARELPTAATRDLVARYARPAGSWRLRRGGRCRAVPTRPCWAGLSIRFLVLGSRRASGRPCSASAPSRALRDRSRAGCRKPGSGASARSRRNGSGRPGTGV